MASEDQQTSANSQSYGGNSSSQNSQFQPSINAQARQKTGEVIDQVQDKASDVVDSVKEQATSQLNTQKQRLAEGIQNAAAMLLMGSDQLRQNDQAGIAQYTDQIANKMDQFSGFLRESQLSDITTEVESFARREPVLFLGGAFTLGLLAARFLKSSNPSSNSSQNTQALARRQDVDYRATTHTPLTPPPVSRQEATNGNLGNSQATVARHFGDSVAAGEDSQPTQVQSRNNGSNLSAADL